MLIGLRIKNIAVIDEIEVEFRDGFNVLTGETGAGKSIIIDSINMVLGQRTSKELIRNGEQKAVVEAMFNFDDPSVIAALADMGIECEDGSVLIHRDINSDGRGNARINGAMATAAMLKEASKFMVNIHGQQDNQSLLSPASHVEYLDSYADIGRLKEDYRAAYDIVREIEKKIESYQVDEREKERKLDLYRYQINEIDGAKLKPGEEESLELRRDFLEGAVKISDTLDKARNMLYSADINAHDILSEVTDGFSEIASYDKQLEEFYKGLDGISLELDDLTYRIRDYADSVDFNESELDDIEGRLDLIRTLKRKYGTSVEDVFKYCAAITEELDGIERGDEIIVELSRELEEKTKTMAGIAAEITCKRQVAAKTLEEKITAELADLDMNRVGFKVDITPRDFAPNGADAVEFLISANAGEPLKPLSKIASGGEMSRIMLAIKSILADSDNVPTLIFDEIDTGVSGRAAQKIAQKIHKISMKKQVLCITHLAQIASMAGTHYLIEKDVENDVTRTRVRELERGGKVEELSRIIGGAQITELTMKNAAEMLELAERFKAESKR